MKEGGPEWGGIELVPSVSGEHAFDNRFGVRFQLNGFFVPSEKFASAFFYVGPTFNLVHTEPFSLWSSLQFVGVLNAFPDSDEEGPDEDSDGVGPSLWVKMDLFHEKISVFLEADVYFSVDDRGVTYYGAYAVSAHPAEWISLGLTLEQLNKNFFVGPHIGAGFGPFSVELLYLIGGETPGKHALRIAAGLSF